MRQGSTDLNPHRMIYLRSLLFAVLFQSMTQALGQSTFIKGGINLSSLAGLSETGSLVGYHFAVGGLKPLSDNLSIKHELVFSKQGTKVTDDFKLVLYYLNVPILIDLRLGKDFSLNAGPQLGLALRALEKGGLDGDMTANLTTLDISACLGANYLISQRLFAEARFNMGLTNLSRVPESDSFRNAVFQGSVGYYFSRKQQPSE